VEELTRRGFRLLPIDPAERDTLATNVLALGGGRLLALAENRRTNARLTAAGFEVWTFPGGELGINGGGGPTCLTRPLLREAGG
jgi:N-dimethylarginine dimethylaminohydrolase